MELSTKHMRDLFGGNVPVAQVLQGIAAGLADCGVTVAVDPKVTVPQAIPSQKKILLPAYVKSERALLIVSWYLDHETGHIIFTPPPETIVDAWKQQSRMLDVCKTKGYPEIPEEIVKTAHFFLNCVEDARIENLMVRRFAGCKKHFIGGPIALDLRDVVGSTVEQAKELQKLHNLPNPPLNPFFMGEWHASSLLNGKHGQMDRDYVRQVAPPHIGWVLDIAEDNFGDIRDVCSVTCEDLAERTDKTMALILEKKLPDLTGAEEEEEEGDQEGQQGGGDDRFAEDFEKPKKSKSKKSKKSKKGSEKGEKSDDNEESEDGDESDDSGDGSDSGDDEGDVGDEDGSGSEGESESENGEGSASGDSDGDEEDESDSGSDSAGSDSMSDTGDDEGDTEKSPSEDEASDGDGDEEDGEDGSDGDPEDDDSEGDEGNDGEDDEEGDRSEEGDETGEAESEEEGNGDEESPNPVTGDIQTNADFQQLIEWAKEAQTDMAQMMREAQAAEEAAEQAGNTPGDSSSSGSPTIPHAKDIAGMPEEYLKRIAPGVSVLVIADQDLNVLIDSNAAAFNAYDQFIQEIMPRDLGPAARRLMGKFKSAPGKAWQGNRVNPKMLQPIVSGHAHGRPLYLRRQETVQSRKGVVVMLCIDCSGSMVSGVSGLNLPRPHNSKFTVSHAAARGISRLLQRIQIPFAVMGYTTDSTHVRYNYSYDASRSTDIVNFLFKDFHEPWSVSEQKMLAMNAQTRTTYKGRSIYPETNSDGESLLWAATQVITRPESKKIMIVLSDGLPAAGDYTMQSKFLKWAVRRIEIAGIQIGALGIGDRGVTEYYRVYELLDVFPAGWGDKNTAPYYIQEKLLTLIDRLAIDRTES